MPNTIHAFDFLAEPRASQSVQVLFGDEPFLKRLVLAAMPSGSGLRRSGPGGGV